MPGSLRRFGQSWQQRYTTGILSAWEESPMKIKEQTIQALDELSEAELMLVNDWITQLRESHHPAKSSHDYKISYERLHAATKKCKISFSEEISRQREERV